MYVARWWMLDEKCFMVFLDCPLRQYCCLQCLDIFNIKYIAPAYAETYMQWYFQTVISMLFCNLFFPLSKVDIKLSMKITSKTSGWTKY